MCASLHQEKYLHIGFCELNAYRHLTLIETIHYCVLALDFNSAWMWNLGCGGGSGGLLVHIILCLFFFLSMLDPAVSVANGSGLVSARLWIEINTMDKAIKALFVPFVTTGWGLKQSVFYQCQRCDETWLTQEANGIKSSICQPSSRADWFNSKRTESHVNLSI